MSGYLRRAAERGAGVQAGQIAPARLPRFAQPYDVPSILMPPAPGFGTVNAPPVGDETPGAAPLTDAGAEADVRLPRADLTNLAPIASERRPDLPSLTPSPAAVREDARDRRGIVRDVIGGQPAAPAARTAGHEIDRTASAQAEQSGRDLGARPTVNGTQPPVSGPPRRAESEPLRADRRTRGEAIPIVAPVSVEPPRSEARPTPVRERPTREVRVSIGRIDVRVAAEAAPGPTGAQPAGQAASSVEGDPFASLALARRGWRLPF